MVLSAWSSRSSKRERDETARIQHVAQGYALKRKSILQVVMARAVAAGPGAAARARAATAAAAAAVVVAVESNSQCTGDHRNSA